MGCDFVSGHTHTELYSVCVIYVQQTRHAVFHWPTRLISFIIKGFLKTRKPVDDVVVATAWVLHCNVVIAGVPKVRRYKLATEKRFHGRRKIFCPDFKGRISGILEI